MDHPDLPADPAITGPTGRGPTGPTDRGPTDRGPTGPTDRGPTGRGRSDAGPTDGLPGHAGGPRGGSHASPLAQLETELAAVAEREVVVRAWVDRPSAGALRRSVADAPPGPLQGWTIGVKDVIDAAGLRAERGAALYQGRTAEADAAAVALARQAGAVVAGKTATAELALVTPTVTTNPHDATRTPGGSSSGSAAAVAAGMVRLALGTQTAGSVIRPASFCGVVGFKATFGWVSVSGVHPVSPSLDTVGSFARTVADVAALHTALTGRVTYGGSDRGAADAAPGPLRVGLYRSHQWPVAGPDTVAALERAVDALRAAGAVVEPVEPVAGLADAAEVATTIMLAEAWRSLAWERSRPEHLLSAGLRRLLARAERVTADEYASAQRRAVAQRAAFDAAVAGFDAWLTPAAPGEAPGMETTGDPAFCRVWTLLGGPALTVPAGTGSMGLPVGVQLVGARWDDARVLAVGAVLEAAMDQAAEAGVTGGRAAGDAGAGRG